MYNYYPSGKYRCKHLTIGIDNSPDIFQQNINDLFHGFGFIRAYTDYLSILTKWDFIDHVQKLELTPNKLKGKGLKCNIEEYFFGQTKMEYLGFWVSHDEIKPINRNIEAIQNMNPYTYQK